MNLLTRQKLLLDAENRLTHAKKVVSDKLRENFVRNCEGKTVQHLTVKDGRIFIQFHDGTYWYARTHTDDGEAYLSIGILESYAKEAKLYVTEEELTEIKDSEANLNKIRHILAAVSTLEELAGMAEAILKGRHG